MPLSRSQQLVAQQQVTIITVCVSHWCRSLARQRGPAWQCTGQTTTSMHRSVLLIWAHAWLQQLAPSSQLGFVGQGSLTAPPPPAGAVAGWESALGNTGVLFIACCAALQAAVVCGTGLRAACLVSLALIGVSVLARQALHCQSGVAHGLISDLPRCYSCHR